MARDNARNLASRAIRLLLPPPAARSPARGGRGQSAPRRCGSRCGSSAPTRRTPRCARRRTSPSTRGWRCSPRAPARRCCCRTVTRRRAAAASCASSRSAHRRAGRRDEDGAAARAEGGALRADRRPARPARRRRRRRPRAPHVPGRRVASASIEAELDALVGRIDADYDGLSDICGVFQNLNSLGSDRGDTNDSRVSRMPSDCSSRSATSCVSRGIPLTSISRTPPADNTQTDSDAASARRRSSWR